MYFGLRFLLFFIPEDHLRHFKVASGKKARRSQKLTWKMCDRRAVGSNLATEETWDKERRKKKRRRKRINLPGSLSGLRSL